VAEVTPRTFVPLNREDVLLVLSGLIATRQPIGEYSGLPVEGDRLAVVGGGLRASEGALLAAGQESRFPVLLEVREEGGRPLRLDDFLGLRFRTADEMDEFTYRPVAEWSAEALARTVEPELFGLEGEPRFGVSSSEGDGSPAPASAAADRLAGGAATALEFAAMRGDCLRQVARVLGCEVPGEEGGAGDPLANLFPRGLRWILEGGEDAFGPTVVRTFTEASRESGSTLVERVAEALRKVLPEGESAMVGKWRGICQEVFRSRRMLDGTLLSDEGNLWLRAALLASKVDSVGAVASFRAAEIPAGRVVSSVAAWLLGLRRGLTRLPWELKGSRASLLSVLHARLHGPLTDRSSLLSGLEYRESPQEDKATLTWLETEIVRGVRAEEESASAEDRIVGGDAYPPPPEPPAFIGVCEGEPTGSTEGEGARGERQEEVAEPVGRLLAHLVEAGCSVRPSAGEHLEVTLPGGTPVRLFQPTPEAPDLLTFEVHTGKVPSKPKDLWIRNSERGSRWRFGTRDEDLVLLADVWGLPSDQEIVHLEEQLRRLLQAVPKPAARKRPSRSKKEQLELEVAAEPARDDTPPSES
jgi:hypothetical protein